MGQFKRFN